MSPSSGSSGRGGGVFTARFARLVIVSCLLLPLCPGRAVAHPLLTALGVIGKLLAEYAIGKVVLDPIWDAVVDGGQTSAERRPPSPETERLSRETERLSRGTQQLSLETRQLRDNLAVLEAEIDTQDRVSAELREKIEYLEHLRARDAALYVSIAAELSGIQARLYQRSDVDDASLADLPTEIRKAVATGDRQAARILSARCQALAARGQVEPLSSFLSSVASLATALVNKVVDLQRAQAKTDARLDAVDGVLRTLERQDVLTTERIHRNEKADAIQDRRITALEIGQLAMVGELNRLEERAARRALLRGSRRNAILVRKELTVIEGLIAFQAIANTASRACDAEIITSRPYPGERLRLLGEIGYDVACDWPTVGGQTFRSCYWSLRVKGPQSWSRERDSNGSDATVAAQNLATSPGISPA